MCSVFGIENQKVDDISGLKQGILVTGKEKDERRRERSKGEKKSRLLTGLENTAT